ncbi:hypothetical protein EVAR_44111_1 [Eumeta japonica]|uniref:Uncharacterized protein n=1 Tax=Eumeta variegata TaxID=151549 RepID=A0A4C1ZX41_EUMVA|nr:hypothetical protein EVAR_44111_1 [Eumeta japonica]
MSKYPTCENRSHARELQRKVKARKQEVRNDNWSDLMVNITLSHQAYWELAKALKIEGYVPTPALRKSDNSIAVDNQEKGECLANSIEQQCSDYPPQRLRTHTHTHTHTHIHRVEEEVHHRVSLLPEDDLEPIRLDEIRKQIKALKVRKIPSIDDIREYTHVIETNQSWSTSRYHALPIDVVYDASKRFFDIASSHLFRPYHASHPRRIVSVEDHGISYQIHPTISPLSLHCKLHVIFYAEVPASKAPIGQSRADGISMPVWPLPDEGVEVKAFDMTVLSCSEGF